jgi:O-antigen ligase
MTELVSKQLSFAITQGLISIEQVGYVLLVFILANVLQKDFLQLRYRTQRVGLWTVLGLVTFFALFGIFVSYLGIELSPLAAAFSAAIILGMMSHIFAISFFAASLLLRPWELLSRSEVMLIMPQALFWIALVSGLLHSFRKKGFSLVWTKEIIVMVLFAGWVYLSIFQSPDWSSAHADFVAHFSRNIILFLFIINLVREKEDVLALTGSVAFSCSLLALLTAYRMFFDPALQQASARAELFGLIGDPNDVSALLLLALPMVLFFVTQQFRNFTARYLVGGAIFLAVVWLIVVTQSRGAMVALIVLVSAYAYTWIKSKLHKLIFFALIGIAALGLFSTLKRAQSDLEASQAGRMSYWKAGIQMAIRHPLLGVGYQAFPIRLPEYVDSRFSESGPRTAHSTWILLVAETGFVGLGLFMLLYFWALRAAWAMLPRRPDLFFSLVGYGAAFSFLSHSYVILPYILLAVVFSASYVQKSSHINVR